MQQYNDKKIIFNKILGNLIQQIRESNTQVSISKIARDFYLDRGNLSKIERGINSCNVITLWKICEANNISFSDFAKRLEIQLGNDFKFMDE